jgi:hypothetical protein
MTPGIATAAARRGSSSRKLPPPAISTSVASTATALVPSSSKPERVQWCHVRQRAGQAQSEEAGDRESAFSSITVRFGSLPLHLAMPRLVVR